LANIDYPAKYVNLRSSDKKRERPPSAPPSPSAWFFDKKEEIEKHFNRLIQQIDYIVNEELQQFEAIVDDINKYPFPLVIELQHNKIAKTHRPTIILDKMDSDVIAIQELGKLVINVNKNSLLILLQLILDLMEEIPNNRNEWIINSDNKKIVTKSKNKLYDTIHQLTCIKNIRLYSTLEINELVNEESMENIRKDKEFKVRFFDYGNRETNQLVFSNFLKNLKPYGLNRNRVRKLDFTEELDIYAIPYISDDLIELASHFPGIELVTEFNYFESVSQEAMLIENPVKIIYPIEGQDYPKVAIVDSGINKNNQHLQPWVEDTDIYVIESNQDNYHGEFVAGIINYGHVLNNNLCNIMDSGVKILDVTILPDPKKEKVREDDLLASLEQALEVYSHKYKVWNLSLTSNRICKGYVSDFTANIDRLQKRFNVLFVIATGNDELNLMRRITSPADSIRGVTVGSIALDSTNINQVEKNNVVPYSRKGPGVGLSIKPDIVHFSGNPIYNPIFSINSVGEKVGDYGTSFSTPLVSAILSEYFSLYPNNMTPLMAKTLLIHGAEKPINNGRIKEIATHYKFGYGLPKRITDILYGDEHEITLLIEGEIDSSSGTNWISVEQLPFPQSFYDETTQKIKGNILVTLGYDTPLNMRYGSEYCRSNLDIRIRTKIGDKFEKITHSSKVNNNGIEEKWERERITKESKWSNIKQVEFRSPSGRKGTNELFLEVLPNWRDTDEKTKIPFVIALTIRDPKREIPVYNEVTQSIAAQFASNDIKLKNAPIRLEL